ncbi:MAG: restriction endonuclease subunit S [Clostridiales bacterium]|nr:restriction endonuclease subunit S [Clostridiales bacterium]
MGLRKYKLGELIEQCNTRNIEETYTLDDVKGISTEKDFMDTKANMDGVSLSSYKVVCQQEFAYVADTSRRGDKIAVAFNTGSKPVLISSIYTAFRVSENKKLLSDYLFMYFNRPEFDRYARFNSWGSARETFDWNTMCDIDMELPDITIQRKYVDIYNAMVANQQSYERGLEDLKLVCDGYIEDLRRKMPCEKIGQYLRECNEKNDNNAISLFQGVTVDHVFTDPKRVAEDSENGSVVRTGQFAFNKVMKAHNTKLPIALREGPDCVVSNSYQVFEVIDEKKILPKYLILWMNRAETQRYAGFISFGTTRDIFTFENMGEIAIPIPNIETQQAIADIFAVYQKRVGINKQLKAQIKDICPVLIKGSLEEGSAQNG